MPRTQRGYRCSACDWQTVSYVGRCANCSEWNTLEPFDDTPRGPGPRGRSAAFSAQTLTLSAVEDDITGRISTEIPELDRVLGGGLVPGALILIGGEPGIGKSTLVLEAAARLAARGTAVGYVCGEESPRQVRLRATRLGIGGDGVTLVPETALDAALAAIESIAPPVAIIDSIQSVYVEGLESRAGGPAQLAEAGARLVRWAKSHDIATIVTGHVTKAGEIAGPRLLEHLVDVVLYFETAQGSSLRILRSVKNRFGATDEVGVFEMTGSGLQSVENVSAAFLEEHDADASGCAVTAVIEGSRPLAVEVQALAVPSALATPRRIAAGIETARLHLLLAVLARRGGVNAGNLDVIATVSGGLRLRDPSADLAVVMALASAVRDVPLPRDTAFVGEVALSGTIRPVQQMPRRLAELARLGFRRCVVPAGTDGAAGMDLVPVRTLADLMHDSRFALFESPGTREARGGAPFES